MTETHIFMRSCVTTQTVDTDRFMHNYLMQQLATTTDREGRRKETGLAAYIAHSPRHYSKHSIFSEELLNRQIFV
jgi:hypothetical protein